MAANQRLVKLAHHVTFYELPSETIEDMVMSVLNKVGQPTTKSDLHTKIEEILGITLSKKSVKRAAGNLIHDGRVLNTPHGLILSGAANDSIVEIVERRKKQEDLALDYWTQTELYDYNLEEAERQAVKADLQLFLKTFFLRHGAGSLKYLTSSLSDSETASDAELNRILRSMRWSSTVSRIVGEDKFLTVFQSSHPDVIRYLQDLFGTATSYLINVCDPEIINRLTSRLSEKIVYLDSNIVYRLLNLQGRDRAEAVRSTLELCKEHGIRLVCSLETLQELKRRIRFDSEVLIRNPTRVNLAAVGVKFLSDENFVSTYWEIAQEKGVSVDDFISYYEHIEDILTDEGIEIEQSNSISTDDFQLHWSDVEARLRSHDSFRDGEYQKSDLSYRHDAYNIAYVYYLKQSATDFLDSPAWFLTADHGLVNFQVRDTFLKHEPQLILMPSQLLTLLAFTTPSNSRYTETFLELFSRTFVPAQTELSNEQIQEILGRIEFYKATPELAEKVLSDKFVTNKLKHAETLEERDEVIHEALLEKAGEVQLQLQKASEELRQLQSENETIRQRSSAEKATNESKLEEMQKIIKVLSDGDEENKEKLAKLERFTKRTILVAKYTTAAVVALAGLGPLIDIYSRHLWGTMHSFAHVLILTSPFLGLLGAIAIAFGKKRAVQMLVIIGALADIATIATTLGLYGSH